MKSLLVLVFAAAVPLAAEADPVGPCPDGSGPRDAVVTYLTAMHQHRFDDAYDVVTPRMTDGRPRAAWAALQAAAYEPGAVEIYGVDVRAPMATAADPACAALAVVPNVLSSRDRLNVHGNVELEIYRVVHENGAWRVDEQQTLFDDHQIRTWFPEAASFTGG
ncbi:MAG: hypothetical protein ACU85V_03655 [Gammaproteobacteria bacterium]